MSVKSVVFIEPSGNRANVFDSYMRLPLLGTLSLGTILDAAGYEVHILNENILAEPFDPLAIRADVFCITALTVSANRARFLAEQLRETWPDALLLIGGIHASLLPEEFTDVADHVIVGEAEGIIVDLVEGRYTERIVKGSPVAEMEDLPLLNYRLLSGLERMETIPIMTSRGCPFDCNFCTVTKIFGRRFRKQSADRILAEIENAIGVFTAREFFFYDDNFTADRKRIDRLCDLLLERNLDITWAAQVRSDLAREPELVAKMAEAGLKWVYIGFESIDDATLKDLHKNQTRADIEHAITTFHANGIKIHGMFMFGEDRDDLSSVEQTLDFALHNGIDTVQFMILTPFPGTACYDRIDGEGRLLHRNWDYYNGMFAVFRPQHMKTVALSDAVLVAYRRFYSLRRVLLDGLALAWGVLLDATAWNFRRAHRYNLDLLFLRAGARLIVSNATEAYTPYRTYLIERERERQQLNRD